uniref:Putative rhipicephalus family xiii n=1 Tax=Rhipicephalus pulchellus TaxID=72859 RepID=L7LVV8_RHIPC
MSAVHQQLEIMRTLCVITFLALVQFKVFAVAKGKKASLANKTVVARIKMSYDSNYSSNFANKTNQQNITAYLIKLVKKAEEHFNKESIMIMFNVTSVEEKNNYFVFYENGSVNGMKTLENMQTIARSEGASNKTIYCHCSGNTFYAAYPSKVEMHRLSDMATNSTFCHAPSALLFVNYPGHGNYRSLAKALGTTMGARNNFYFTPQDKAAMNKTLTSCPKENKRRRKADQGGGRRRKEAVN